MKHYMSWEKSTNHQTNDAKVYLGGHLQDFTIHTHPIQTPSKRASIISRPEYYIFESVSKPNHRDQVNMGLSAMIHTGLLRLEAKEKEKEHNN